MSKATEAMLKQKKSTHDRAERMRKRIEDAIMLLGHRDWEDGRKEFARRAVLIGKSKDMRMWRGKTQTHQEAAEQSLRLLFGEMKSSRTLNGKTYESSGHNAGWVLDLWDAVLQEMYYKGPGEEPAKDRSQEAAKRTDKIVATGRLLDKDEPTHPGVRMGPPIKATVGKPVSLTTTRPLTMRLLEAYTKLDSETFMTLLLEVEELGA